MWLLIIIGLTGSTVSTQITLEDCQRNFKIVLPHLSNVRDASCVPAGGGTAVHIIKDGKAV